MEFNWVFSNRDAKMVQSVIKARMSHWLVQQRIQRNLRRNGIQITDASIWRVLVGCLVTTQQRSSGDSPVARFIDSNHDLLKYGFCRKVRNLQAFAQKHLSTAGIRRNSTIADEISRAMRDTMQDSTWLQAELKNLNRRTTKEKERKLARALSAKVSGFGPKQSRNFIQWIGVSKHEIPLDSRITKWLRAMGFPVPVSALSLADEEYYSFVLDGVQKLCQRANVLPCVFDAAVFASFDKE